MISRFLGLIAEIFVRVEYVKTCHAKNGNWRQIIRFICNMDNIRSGHEREKHKDCIKYFLYLRFEMTNKLVDVDHFSSDAFSNLLFYLAFS